MDGIKFGLRKQPGAVALGDEAQAIRRLRERFPNRAEALIRVRETLDRAALRKLPAAELAQIGVTIEKATDEVTIATGRDDLDRVVAALLDGLLASGGGMKSERGGGVSHVAGRAARDRAERLWQETVARPCAPADDGVHTPKSGRNDHQDRLTPGRTET